MIYELHYRRLGSNVGNLVKNTLSAPSDREHRLLASNPVQERTHISEPVMPTATPSITLENVMFSSIVKQGYVLISPVWGK
jgi:hypothetical protein